MPKLVMKHTERNEIIDLIRSTLRNQPDVVRMQPLRLITPFAVFVDVSALALISSDDGMLRCSRDGLPFRERNAADTEFFEFLVCGLLLLTGFCAFGFPDGIMFVGIFVIRFF